MASGASAEPGQAGLRVGDVNLVLDRRHLSGPSGGLPIEPRVAQVMALLSSQQGSMVSRDALFEHCWGSPLTGDDSLNRSIYQLRRALNKVGSRLVSVETVAAAGYVLNVIDSGMERVCDEARRSWRLGLPRGERQTIAKLQEYLSGPGSHDAEGHGLLAMHLARASEYEPVEEAMQFARDCESSAVRALELDPCQPDAMVARASLLPLFGRWVETGEALQAILRRYPGHFAAQHETAVLHMSTGCVATAVPIIADLLDRDPLAATLHYKRGYHLFCLGRLDEMDRVLDNALQAWPGHAGIWQARTLTLAFTGRIDAAIRSLEDAAARPPMPPDTLAFHRLALGAIVADEGPKRDAAVASICHQACWQSTAAAAVMYLSALDRPEQAMQVCEAFFLRGDAHPVTLRYEPAVEASVNEFHRRATQLLFIPTTEPLRQHPRFGELCRRIGMVDYWDRTGMTPDFMS